MLTTDRLRELLSYDPQTGDMTWKKLPVSKQARLGKPAGYVPAGNYRQIGIGGKLYNAHRLAWLYMTGEWPKHYIDHRDGDKSNNRWDNLREATSSENLCNRGPQKNGNRLKGVHHRRTTGKWRALISKHGKIFYLGEHDTEQQAHDAYAVKARELHGEFARLA